MKYNDNGTYKDIYVKAFDTLPVGTEVDYDGNSVPDGWTQVENEVVLYNDTEGSNGTINLSDNISNYKFIDIYYFSSTSDNRANYARYDVKLGSGSLNLFNASCDSGHGMYLRSRDINISGTQISTNGQRFTVVNINTNNQLANTSANEIYIRKVIGYK